MGKQPHPFCLYFELISNPNNKTNKYAVCICCIEEYTQNIAITKKECHVNKVKFCYDHLANCEILKKWYDESECAEIFALGNDDNNKIIKTTKIQVIQVKEKVSMIFNLLLFSTNGIESSNHT